MGGDTVRAEHRLSNGRSFGHMRYYFAYDVTVNEASAVLIGSAISAIVAMVVVALQNSLERRRQSLADRADRLGDFLSATYAVSSGIEEVAIAAPKSKFHMEADVRSAAQDRLNNSLTRLRLFEDADVVTTATYLERELTRINSLARNQQWARDAWRMQRSELARITHEYETVARQKLGRGQLRNELGFYWTDLPVSQGTESSLCTRLASRSASPQSTQADIAPDPSCEGPLSCANGDRPEMCLASRRRSPLPPSARRQVRPAGSPGAG